MEKPRRSSPSAKTIERPVIKDGKDFFVRVNGKLTPACLYCVCNPIYETPEFILKICEPCCGFLMRWPNNPYSGMPPVHEKELVEFCKGNKRLASWMLWSINKARKERNARLEARKRRARERRRQLSSTAKINLGGARLPLLRKSKLAELGLVY